MKIAGDGVCELRQLYEMPADTCAKQAGS
jgi:hypothetical protein